MTGRERAIGAVLAIILVIGIIDAAAGQNGSTKHASTRRPAATLPSLTPSPLPSTTAGPASPSAAPSGGVARSQGRRGTSSPATPTPSRPAPTGSQPAPSRSSARQAPPPGVLGTFSYATTGYEQTNIPNTRRTYPSTTEITNKAHGCGVLSTWKPVSQHVQKQLICPSGSDLKIKAYQTTISFFGVSSGESFKCAGASYVYRPHVTAGTVWKYRCKSPDAVASQTATVIGYQTVDVGGTAVRALHVHVSTKLSGNSSGTSVQDYWIDTNRPVLVKETGTVNATQQSVHYTESYSLALKSLSPKT